MEHLNDETTAVLGASERERISYIQSPKWILHDRVREVLEAMEERLIYEKSSRMPNLLIYGDSGSGKTMVLTEFLKKHPPRLKRATGTASVPALFINTPPGSNENKLYATILETMSFPYRSTKDAIGLRTQVFQVLRNNSVRMLILDEIHHLVNVQVAKQRHMLDVLKDLSNELQIPIVAAGTKEAMHVMWSQPEVARRFAREHLPQWTLGEDYLRLLMSFERRIPLRKPSQLHSEELATLILVLSGGYIGEISRLLAAAAQAAISDGTEQITVPLVKGLRHQAILGMRSESI